MSKLPGDEELIRETFVKHFTSIRERYCMSTCPITMVKNLRQYNATVCKGEARTLKAPQSDVSLSLPKGSKGLFISRAHTDHFRFKDFIPDEECIIGPPIELEQPEKQKDGVFYIIKIPHCLPDKKSWKDIKVRYGNIHRRKQFQEVPRRGMMSNGDMYFEVKDGFILIYTQHFSHFTCTACNRTCNSAIAFLFGNLRVSEAENASKAQIKAYICSTLYSSQDFVSVNINISLLNIFQTLLQFWIINLNYQKP